MLNDLVAVAVDAAVALDIPDPGPGSPPPGKMGQRFIDILRWAKYLAGGMCLLGVLGVVVDLEVSRRGQHGFHLSKLGSVFAGCVLLGSAVALVTFLTS